LSTEIYLDRYLIGDGDVTDLETGEQLSRKVGHAILNQKIKDDHKSNVEMMLELDGDVETRLVKNKHGKSFNAINVKKGYDFVKTFKVELREIVDESSLSLDACGFMYKMINHLHFPSNSIVIDYSNPSIDKLCEVVKVKKSKLYKILKELEEEQFIIRTKIDGDLIIYINPLLHSCGLVDTKVYNMFVELSKKEEHQEE